MPAMPAAELPQGRGIRLLQYFAIKSLGAFVQSIDGRPMRAIPRHVFHEYAAICLALLLLGQCARADAPSADIDPGRLDPGRLPSRMIIDPGRIPNERLPRNSIDPGKFNTEPPQFRSIDPGRPYVPVIPPRWNQPQRLYLPGVGFAPLDSTRPTVRPYDPGPLSAPRLRIAPPIKESIDPGRLYKPTILLPPIDPGPLPRQGSKAEMRGPRSTIFRGLPGRNATSP